MGNQVIASHLHERSSATRISSSEDVKPCSKEFQGRQCQVDLKYFKVGVVKPKIFSIF